jgi:predicted HTH transcriptional regulator
MEHAVLKTLAAFLNSNGGTLFVGVNDDSEVIGLDQDQFPNEDKMLLHLDELIKGRLGGAAFACLKPEIGERDGKKFLAVECKPSKQAVFLKTGNEEVFHIRAGASSPALLGKQALDYIQQQFK